MFLDATRLYGVAYFKILISLIFEEFDELDELYFSLHRTKTCVTYQQLITKVDHYLLLYLQLENGVMRQVYCALIGW